MPGVLVVPNVVPGPAVEAVRLHMGDIVRRQHVPESITLVDRGPDRSRIRLNRQTDGVTDAVGVNAGVLAVRVELVDQGALSLGVLVTLVHVGAGADRD